jgi:hypothetical protein
MSLEVGSASGDVGDWKLAEPVQFLWSWELSLPM